MFGLSALAQTTIRSSHAFAVRATVTTPESSSFTDLPIVGGAVTLDATSQTRASATVLVDPTYWPTNPLDILAPYGAEMLVEYGIVLPGQQTEWVPLIQGILSQAQDTVPLTSSFQALAINLVDRSQRVKDDRVSAPLQITLGTNTVVQEITALIQGSYPGVTVIDETADTHLCPTFAIQQDKWTEGVEALATAIGAECFCDRYGGFIIRPQPTLNDLPMWLVDTGDRGILVQNQRTRTRDAVYNQVVVIGQSSSGAPPILATVSDLDPASPTYYNGLFGHKPRFYISPVVVDPTQATLVGQALLARAKGTDTQVQLQTVTNPGLEPGDVIQLEGETGEQLHILDQVTIPLDTQTTQQLTGRTILLPPEQQQTVTAATLRSA